jgi:divinyl protochlorophyllide a 8-vinyl-reductase
MVIFTPSGADANHRDAPQSVPLLPAFDHMAGRIGPNAITRVAEALRARLGEESTVAIFRAAGLAGYLTAAPDGMVREEEVGSIQAQLRERLGASLAGEISLDAGRRTGDYLLANRIPPIAKFLLKLLPPSMSARTLASAISRHAWTFAGTGTFSYSPGRPFGLVIAGCPLCRNFQSGGPACDYYAGTFERIFSVLVSPHCHVTETECVAAGGTACRFQVDW